MVEGMKQTELGMIPEDWEVKRIAEISNPVRGGSPRPAGSALYFNGAFIPWLTVASLTNISESKIFVTETESFLTELGSHYSRNLKKGTLIISNSGATLGVAKVLGIDCCANDGIAALLELKADNKYIAYFINSITEHLRTNIATGNGQPNLNTELIGNLHIPLPPLPEQEAIAGALSDADAWIESLEQLIAKKRLIKQGAMQELLMPKEGWEVKKLGEVCEIKKGQMITSSMKVDGNIPVIAGGKTPAYFHNKPNRKGKTITISASGASAGYIGFHNYPIFASDCSTINEDEKYCIEFLYYFLARNQEVIYGYQTGGAQPHIHAKDIQPMLIGIPSLTEQTRIATILSDMDAELEALEQQLHKARQIKQGMMQELLTGKVRLI